jgi:hypothetical protein
MSFKIENCVFFEEGNLFLNINIQMISSFKGIQIIEREINL